MLAALESLGAEFGDMAFMLSDLARAAGEIQDSLSGQDAELRAARERAVRQAADVRMIREELAVIEQRTGQWQPEPAEPSAPVPRWDDGCPYRGLLPYDQAHAAVFCGRERLTAELAGLLAGTGIVMVTGASGAGKTSLLRAGLVPALARGVQVPGSQGWPVVSLTVTARPLTDLAAGLARLDDRDPVAVRQRLADAPGQAHLLIRELTRNAARLMLIIDQFERVFAADGAQEQAERAAFLDALSAAAARPAGPRGEPPARVVIAVRGDYWDRCAALSQLVAAMERDQLVVGPMPDAGLRRAITGPAGASGLRVESALIDAIVADTSAIGASLPMFSQALALTWENREDGRLTRAGYDQAGRMAGAIEAGAEAVYARLTEDQRAIARDVLRQMTAVDRDGRLVRRPLPRAGRDGRADAVLGALAQGRLVVLGDDTAEIAHDALLQAWPRLRGWLEEDQSSLILYGQLAEDTARWRDGKDPSRLYQGVRLAAAREAARVWAADPGRYPALPAAEAEFLRASGRAGTWRRVGRRSLAGALVLLLLAALAGAGLAVRSARDDASRQRTIATSARLAGQSAALEATDPVTASLLAGAAWRIAPTAQARYSLLESLAQPVRGILSARSGQVTAVASSPDGKTLAAAYRDGTIRLWDTASHRLVGSATWGGAADALAFTGGGKNPEALEVAGPTAAGAWNLAGRAKIARHPLAGLTAVTGGRSAAFSRDGSTLATGGDDGNVRLWDVATEQEIGAPMSSGLAPVEAVAFSPRGATVAAGSSDGTVQLWDATTQHEVGTTMTAGPAAIRALAFGPGRKVLAAGGEDGDVRLWDTATQSQPGATMATGAAVAALSFSGNGTTLATAEGDGRTELWSTATQKQTGAALAAQGSARVSALDFGPGADLLATGDATGTITLWNPAGFHQSSAPVVAGTPESAAAARRARARRAQRPGRGHRRQRPTRHDTAPERPDRADRRPADRRPSRGDRAGAQPGRQAGRRHRHGREGPAVERGHPAANRNRGGRRASAGRAGVQPGRPDRRHGRRERDRGAVERDHRAPGRRADERGCGRQCGPGGRRGGVQPGRPDPGHGHRQQHPPVGHGDTAANRHADDGRTRPGLRGRLQPGRRHAGHRGRRRHGPAVGRGYPAGDRHADDGRPGPALRGRLQPGRPHADHRRRRRRRAVLGRGLPGRAARRRLRHRGPIPYPPAVG